jgi:molecular chaperone GrpE
MKKHVTDDAGKAQEHDELLNTAAQEGEWSQGNAAQEAEPTDRVAELEAELEQQREQLNKYRDELLRRAADFENFRRQKEREVLMVASRSLENTIKELLPVVDDIKRLLQHVPTASELSGEARPYIEGVELVKKNLEKWFAEKGVNAIQSIGATLDVNFHEAISQVDHPKADPDTIIEEYQTGYLLGDKVLRHAKVIVAR